MEDYLQCRQNPVRPNTLNFLFSSIAIENYSTERAWGRQHCASIEHIFRIRRLECFLTGNAAFWGNVSFKTILLNLSTLAFYSRADIISGFVLTTEYVFYCKRAILFLSSSKILTPHPPLRPANLPSPRNKGGVHTRRAERGMGGQYFGRREK